MTDSKEGGHRAGDEQWERGRSHRAGMSDSGEREIWVGDRQFRRGRSWGEGHGNGVSQKREVKRRL
jgi:hypothetical protein